MANPKKIGQHQSVSYRMVDPRELTLDPDNQRIYDAQDPDNIALRKSLVDEGVLSALDIYEDGVVDNGNRRLFNIQFLMEQGQWTRGAIPAIIVERPANKVEATVRRLNKNEARQFSPLEQGMAFASLRDGGLNNSQIAARTPFTSMHIGNMLTLHDSAQEVRDAVRLRQISATLAVEVIRKHGDDVLLKAVALSSSQGRDRATSRHVDAVVEAATPPVTPQDAVAYTAPTAPGTPVEAESEVVEVVAEADAEVVANTDADAEGVEVVEVVAEAGAEVVADADANTVPFDLDGTAPQPPVVDAEVEVEVTPSAPSSFSPGANGATNRGSMTPKALLTIISPTIEALADVMKNGTKAEKLEVLAAHHDDLTAFLANIKKMGLGD